MQKRNTPLIRFLLLLAIAAAWGPSFLFIKIAVAEIPPLTLATLRVGLAAVVLTLIMWSLGRSLPRDGRTWRFLFISAFFHMSAPFALFAWGEQFVDSALAAILNGVLPVFTVVMSHYFVPGDRLTTPKVIGVSLGFAGLLFLVGPPLFSGVRGTTLGVIAIVISVLMFSIAFIIERLTLRGLEPLVAPSAQLLAATAMLLPFMWIERAWTLPFPSWSAISALAALSIIGTAIAFIFFYALLERADPSYMSMAIYLLPIFGAILGVVVLGERLYWYTLVGFGLILVGVAIVNGYFVVGRRESGLVG